MRKRIGNYIGRIAALVLLCIVSFPFGGYAQNTSENVVICNIGEYTSYPEAVSKMLPSYSVKQAYNVAFFYLEEGVTTEAFDAQADSALVAGLAKFWYPHYLATVVIAVDRDKTDAHIKSWSDLPAADEKVGFCVPIEGNYRTDNQMLFAAIAFGLEGDGFTLQRATELLGALQTKNRFVLNSFEQPITICYDHQAAELIKNGRNIEVVVPDEGTLTYEKGLLSNRPLEFTDDAESLLLRAGFRLPGGRCDGALYPDSAAYEKSSRIKDYEHFNVIAHEAIRVLRRGVIHVRMYTSADGREHQFFVLVYIIIVVLWTASLIHRTMQKGARRAALITGALLLGWIIVRLIKYQLPTNDAFNRYLWYSFYLFELSLPLVLLWLACIIDKPDDEIVCPKWLQAIIVVNGAICALTYTNDFHLLVFPFDLTNPNYAAEHGYGIGAFFITAGWLIPLLTAVVILLRKSGGNVRKKGLVFPLAFFLLLIAYGSGYMKRIPIAYESDISMVIGLFTLFFSESIIRSGMIPVNTKYAALFTHSPLGMQIVDNCGNTSLPSASALKKYDNDMFMLAQASYPLPARQEENTLLFSAPITGGYALWQEDIGSLNRLHKDIEKSVSKLAASNAVLAEEERIKRDISEENAKNQLMSQLEAEIAEFTAKLSAMIDRLENAPDRQKETARVAFLLSHVKRRCNLFFRERETGVLPADELMVYIYELAEIADYAGVRIAATNEFKTRLSVRRATLFYDFFYHVVDWVAQHNCSRIVAHLGSEHGNIVMRLLTSEDAGSFQMYETLSAAISSAGGTCVVKDLDDAVGISLSFPEEGESDA